MKTYIKVSGGFDDPEEAANSLYRIAKNVCRTLLINSDETKVIIEKFAKRYELTCCEAERAIKGLAYTKAARRYNLFLATNFGQYNLCIEKRNK